MIGVVGAIAIGASAVLARNVGMRRMCGASGVFMCMRMAGHRPTLIGHARMRAVMMYKRVSRRKAQPIAESQHGYDHKYYELAKVSAHDALNRCLRGASILGPG